MPLGRRPHRFRAREHHADRAVQHPGRQRDERLDPEVQLAAEPATARTGDHADLLVGEAEDERDLVAVHVRGLGGREDGDPVADPLRIPGLGFDVGVLDVARSRTCRSRRRPRPRGRLRHRRARRDQPPGCCRVSRRGAARRRARRQRPCRRSAGARPRSPGGRCRRSGRRCRRHRRARRSLPPDSERSHRPGRAGPCRSGRSRSGSARGRPPRRGPGQDPGGGVQRRDVADRESGMRVRRADRAQRERSGGYGIGAEHGRAGHLVHAVHAGDPRADDARVGRVGLRGRRQVSSRTSAAPRTASTILR